MRFTCPKCEKHRIEEIMVDVTVATTINNIIDDGDHIYGEQTNDGGETERYQCMDCGCVLEDKSGEIVRDCVELATWIKENCPQEDGQ